MNTRVSYLFCIATCALLNACATTGVKSTNPAVVKKMNAIESSMATVVIYRESGFAGQALRPTVMLNGKEFVNIGNGRVFVGKFRPGHYAFEMDDKKSGTEADLRAGHALYLRVEIVPGFWKGGGRLTQMAPEQGAFESQRLQLISETEIEIPSYR